MSKNKVAEILIGVTFVIAVISVFRILFNLDKAADTKLYDRDALDYLKDEENRKKLDDYVKEYYNTGKWDETILV